MFVRFIKNKLGELRGFGSCPNCGDSWAYKPYGIVRYSEDSGVLLCEECLKNPRQISTAEVVITLAEVGWPAEKINQVIPAVVSYKKEAVKP